MGGSSKYEMVGVVDVFGGFLEDNFTCKTLLFIWSTLQETNMAIECFTFSN